MGKLYAFLFLCLCLVSAHARTCLVTQIHWHVSTPAGMTVGVTEIIWGCEDNGGGSTQGDPPSGPGGGDPPPDPSTPCIWPNATAFTTDYRLVVPYTEMFGFGPDSTRPGGVHNGIDLMVQSGTPIYSPCDGILRITRQDIPRDSHSQGQTGNEASIEPSGSMDPPPKNGSSSLRDGAVHQVLLAHLDENWATNAGVTNNQFVRRGQLIGYTDNTGSIQNMGPHLHITYTTIVNGKRVYVDPNEVANCVRN